MSVDSRSSDVRKHSQRFALFAVLMALVLVIGALFTVTAQAEPLGSGEAAPAADSVADDVADTVQSDADFAADVPVDSSRSGKWIEVILSQQRLIAWQNGRAVMSSAISSGTSRYPTRRGTFKIYVKYRATRMRGPGYNLPGVPYTMYYSGSYAVHGAYWHNNFGHPMSHGCVNLPVSFARRLYAWAPVGTTVVVH